MAGIHHQAQKYEFSLRGIAFALGFRAGGTERDTRCVARALGCASGKSQQREEMASCPAGLRERGGAGAQPTGSSLIQVTRHCGTRLSSVLQARL